MKTNKEPHSFCMQSISSAELGPPTRPLLRKPPLSVPPLRTRGAHHKIGSRTKLRPRDVPSFADAEPPLFSEVAQAVCTAGVLPRKELYEAWEVATRIDAAFENHTRVADLAAGHGLLAWMLLLLARQRGLPRTVVCVDVRMPASVDALSAALTDRWPELGDGSCFHYVEGGINEVVAGPETLLTAVHACGPLSDLVLERAAAANAAAAVVPCCHSLRKQPIPDLPGLTREALVAAADLVGPSAAIDAFRAEVLRARGYYVELAHIPVEISPYNRLLLCYPGGDQDAHQQPSHDTLPSDESGGSAVGPQAVPKGKVPPPLIRIADFKAVAAMSGRRPKEHCRSIELSVWLPEGGPLGLQALHHLASRASSTLWKPKLPSADATDKGGVGGGAATAAAAVAGGGAEAEFWCAPTAVAEARATSAVRADELAEAEGDSFTGSSAEVASDGAASGAASGVASGAAAAAAGQAASAPAPRVRVDLREVYWEDGGGGGGSGGGGAGRRACSYRISFTRLGREVTRGEAALWQARLREAVQHWQAEEDGAFELR